jgi:hypothetical protein
VEIINTGLPVPMKSACFFCPASQPWELVWLAGAHPDLFLRAIAMEDRARAGKHGLTTVAGLWGRDVAPTAKRPEGKLGSWRAWAELKGILRGNEVAKPDAELLAMAESMRQVAEAPTLCAA